MIEWCFEVSNNHKVDSLFTFDFEETRNPYYILPYINKFCSVGEQFFLLQTHSPDSFSEVRMVSMSRSGDHIGSR